MLGKSNRNISLVWSSCLLAAFSSPVQEGLTSARDGLLRAILSVHEVDARLFTDRLTRYESKEAVDALLKAMDLCSRVGLQLEKEQDYVRSKSRANGRSEGMDNWYRKFYELSGKLLSLTKIRAAIGGAFATFQKPWIVPLLSKKLGHGEAISRAYLAEALGSIAGDDSEAALLAQLGKEKEGIVKVAILDALAGRERKSDQAIEAAARLLKDASWQVVLSAAKLLELVEAKSMVPKLIDALDGTHGRVQEELNDVLALMTGVDKHGDHATWKAWWEENGEAYLAGTWKAKPGERSRRKQESTTFYGLPFNSDKVIFAIDLSLSMEVPAAWKPGKDEPKVKGVELQGDRRIDVAKYELKKALALLPDGTKFNIVFFNHFVWSFRPRMEMLDRRMRLLAFRYIDDMGLLLGTDVYEALKLSFKFGGVGGYTGSFQNADVDTLFILTDGEPWLRRDVRGVTDPDKIREAVLEWNKHPKIKINTVGIETRIEADDFLTMLACENGGFYVRR
ncbi:MAG: hypothetical protein HY716_01845 [Planctomycetes bacterium]|nr:hypothetical protein [Planctomycetota bacterium]